MSKKYLPRNDFVLVRLINVGKVGSLVVSDFAKEGKKLEVVAIGPHVKNLEEGDSVLIKESKEAFPLPNERDLFCVKEEDVAMVVKEVE